MEYDLALVMPVYNEAECIETVVRDWDAALQSLGIRYRMLIYNDGSGDNTEEELSCFCSSPTIEVVNKPNEGHGPTILRGYREAVNTAEWVFQCDSDGEMLPEGFEKLWACRADYDALFGYREERIQSRSRAFISMVSRQVVGLFFGRGVKDVNTPYRLMRSELLQPIIKNIPHGTFAPNVLVSGEFNHKKYRIYNTPVKHRHRRTGQVSIVKWDLWKAVIKSFFQTITYLVKRRIGRVR